ncbi:MAG: 16S rRNA (cytosine(1402)-N(4))-methyltransferase RsmH, partial [Bacteroidia bacterium]|nr:16S rRNA (cytosine(1402)-N(4))-methyltransferase RsmH [Bacteroidia bacterium]
SYHTPVLLHTCVDALEIKPSGTYVDATFGGGGHSREILNRLGPEGRLFAFDQDPDAANNVPNDPRLVFVPQNFRFMKNFLRLYKAIPVDGILADLGVSSHQFDKAERGFSTRFEAKLDMRMNPLQGQSALEWLNEADELSLKHVFKTFGEIREAGRLARIVMQQRVGKGLQSTGDLLKIITPLAKRGQEMQMAAQVFQAIRIQVNQELEALAELLLQTPELLKPGGRLVVLSYHSLEDRLVKNFIRSGKLQGEAEKDLFGNTQEPLKAVNRKPLRPTAEEIEQNNRARSAILRIAQRNIQ